MPRECLAIIESKSKVRYSQNKPVIIKVRTNTSSGTSPDVAELKDMVKALLLDKKSQNQAPATVKAVEESCVTCGGAHSYHNCPATDGNVYRDNIQEFVSQAFTVNYNQGNTSYRLPMMNNQNRFNQNQNRGNNFNHGPVYQPSVFQPPAYQAPSYQAPAPQTQGVLKEDFAAYVKANDAVMRNMQTQGQNMQNQLTNMTYLLTKFVNSNNASTSSSGTLPSDTISNTRSDLKAITTRSGVSYDGPQIPPRPSFLPKTETLIIQISKPVAEPIISPVSAPRPNLRPSIPYPSRLQDHKLRDKANDQHEKSFQIFKDLNFNISFVDALILMPKFGPSIKSLLTNKDKLCDLTRTPLNEHCTMILLKKLPEKLGDPSRSFFKNERALINVFEGELTLHVGKEAITFNPDQTLRYSANYSDMTVKRIDVIDLACKEYSQEVLGFSDVIASGNPTPYYDPIVSTTSSTLIPFRNSNFFLEEVNAFLALEDYPTSSKVDQSYLDPEGDILLLEAFLNDDPSVPPPNQGNYLPEVRKELKICEAKSEKSSIDKPPEVKLRDLPPHLEYAFLEGNDKFPVIIEKYLSVEEKTALITVLKLHKRAIAWKLSDIKGIDPDFYTRKILMEEDFEPALQHQRRVNPKIYNVIKQEVIKLLDAGLIYPIFDSPWVSLVHCLPKKGGFTAVENEDNELILTRLFTDQEKTTFTCPYGMFAYRRMPFGLCNAPGTFQSCLSHLERMLKRCEDINLCLNWEKSHFMVKEGIVLGHKISKQGIEVDKAKVDVITKLPHPTTVKARPMTRLLKKDTPFHFSKECFEAFQTLKINLTEAHILIAPDWDMPFELMCDANDFAIGAVLGQHQDKHFRPIHYASKTLTEAESNFTTTEKEMLAVVYDFKKFWSYLIMNKSIVYTDHSPSNIYLPRKIQRRDCSVGFYFSKNSPSKCASGQEAIDILKAFLYGPTGDTMAQITQPRRCLIQDSIGPPYTFAKVMQKFDVTNRLATPYHPQTSGQVEVSKRGLKPYKTPIGCTPYKLVYGKACHLPIELEHKAYWALKHAKFDLQTASYHRKVQLNELHDQAYENSLIYKEKTKRLHDSKIKDRVFNIGDRVLIFNSLLKIFSGKLKSRWFGPFTIFHVNPYGTVELSQPDMPNFKVNGHYLKHYFGEDIPKMVIPDLQTFPKDH
nr:reverse transcriptase domain-containing protein [Tanacetum cinerariifolium]